MIDPQLRSHRGWRLWRALAVTAVLALPLATTAALARRQLAPGGIGTDDAYIFLRYGRNLAAGAGWVWNPGEAPVEGTTSLLWTLATAALFELGRAPLDALFALSIVLVVVGLAVWSCEASRLGSVAGARALDEGAVWFAAAVACDLVARPVFAMRAMVSLMDGAAWCGSVLLVGSSVVWLARAERPRAALAGAVAAQVVLALTRPESMLVGPAMAGAAALAVRGRGHRFLPVLASAVLSQGALVIWRISTFGWPLPNTYYAKVGEDLGRRLSEGASFLLAAAARDPTDAVLWMIAAAVLVLAAKSRSARPEHAPVPAPTLTVAATATLLGPAIVLAEGGGWSTLILLRPLAISTGLLAITGLFRRWGARRALQAAAAVVAMAAAAVHVASPARWLRLGATTRLRYEFDLAQRGLALGARLDRLFARAVAKPRVGVLAAGALPFAYGGLSSDLLGLNDAAMAHESRQREGVFGHAGFSVEAFFRSPPQVVLPGLACRSVDQGASARERLVLRLALGDLGADPRFAESFGRVRLFDDSGVGDPLCAYAERSWLAAGAGGVRWESDE